MGKVYKVFVENVCTQRACSDVNKNKEDHWGAEKARKDGNLATVEKEWRIFATFATLLGD